MKKLISVVCFVFAILPVLNKAHAGLPEHEVISDKKEVWFLPTIKIENWFWYDITKKDNGEVRTQITPYNSEANKLKMADLESAYPGYKIKMYAINIRAIDFKFVQAPDYAFSFFPIFGGDWWASSSKQVLREDIPQVQRVLENQPGMTVTVTVYKGDQIVGAVPEVEYKFFLMSY
jgi:hypothetical protein